VMAHSKLHYIRLSSFLIPLLFVALSLGQVPILEKAERALFILESRLSLSERQNDQRIVLVDVDERSIQILGSWPWPHQVLAEMVELLNRGGAKLISLDLPLVEKEPNTRLAEVAGIREKFEASALTKGDTTPESIQDDLLRLEQSADGDQKLAEAIRHHGNVILPVMTRLEQGQRKTAIDHRALLSRNLLTEKNVSPELKKKLSAKELFFPFTEIAEEASGLGYAAWDPEENMEGLSHRLFLCYDGSLLPSQILRVAIADLGLQPKQVIVEKEQINLKTFAIPFCNGEVLIKYHKGMRSFPRYSFADLLHDQKAPSPISGKIVLVGRTFNDRVNFSTPLGSSLTSIELDGCALESILDRSVVLRPFYFHGLEILAIVAMGALASWFFPTTSHRGRLGLAALLIFLTLGLGFCVFAVMDIWFRTAQIAGSIAVIAFFTSVAQWVRSQRTNVKSFEMNKALALALQKEGLLDLAFEKFQDLPLNEEIKQRLFDLGVEYEDKRMIVKALTVFEYLRQKGGFRHLEARMLRLKEDMEFPIGPSRVSQTGEGLLQTPALEERKRIGRYGVLGILGRGSMGVVYKAKDPKLNRLLAIKTVRFLDEFDEDVVEEMRRRFFKEAEIAGKLSHPSIVTIHDIGEDGDLTYMAMEFLEGINLEKYVTRDRLLPISGVLHVVASVADALEFAHGAKVIHRDIKPANIMILKEGGIKVTDFGIAKAISSSRTKTGVILGTPNYMSPEQIMGQKIDPSSDIFSLGIVFFQLLTGELPFKGDNLSSLLYEITQKRHPKLQDFGRRLPAAMDQITDKFLAKNPRERFKSAGEVARTLGILAKRLDEIQAGRTAKETATRREASRLGGRNR
jgi:eukaryotic-like serine/threonine-protein kinase